MARPDGEDQPAWEKLEAPPPQDIDASAAYHARTPEPNYSEFQPRLADALGREYAVAEHQPDDGRLLLWIRLPIRLRRTVDFPVLGDDVELFDTQTQHLVIGKIDGIFVSGPTKATGHLFLADARKRQPTNTAVYARWLDIKAPPPDDRIL
jgi:hypothetical protein